MRLNLVQRREVEDQRLRELGRVAQPLRQSVAQLDRTKRVEPGLHQRRVGRGIGKQFRRHLAHRRRHVHRASDNRRRLSYGCAPSSKAAEELRKQRSVHTRRSGRDRRRERCALGPHEAAQMRVDLPQRREVKDQRLRQLRRVAQPLRQPVAQLDGAERVEPRLHQRRIDRGTRHQLRRHLAHRCCHVDQRAAGWCCHR